MIKEESDLRVATLRLLAPIHAVWIETSTQEGVPDLNTSLGWIELKFLSRYPRDEKKIVVPRHFTPEQRNWLRKRCASGGTAWLLLTVGPHWHLVWGTAAAEHLGTTWDALTLCRSATGVAGGPPGSLVVSWASAPSSRELIQALALNRWGRT